MRYQDKPSLVRRVLEEVKKLDLERAIKEGRYSRGGDLTNLVIKVNGEQANSRPGRLQLATKFRIRKFENDAAYQQDKPYEVNEFEKNVGLNGGIGEAIDLICGIGGTAYSNANARSGVGTSTTAAVATQAGLLATATDQATATMDATYPSRSAQTVSFRTTFGGAVANFAWNEFVIDNSTATDALIRKVSTQGTKTSGQTWELTTQITVS